MYPNGLRVIRDISPQLLERIRAAGYPYLYRRWMRHDGTLVATASESVLCPDDTHLQSIGIRRWRLQKVLCDAVAEAGIPVVFGKRLGTALHNAHGVECVFEDGTRISVDVAFGADGVKSRLRESMFGPMDPE